MKLQRVTYDYLIALKFTKNNLNSPFVLYKKVRTANMDLREPKV